MGRQLGSRTLKSIQSTEYVTFFENTFDANARDYSTLFSLLCKCSCKNGARAVWMYTLKCIHLWPTKLIPVCRDLLRCISTGNSQSVKQKAHWYSLSLAENSFAWHSLAIKLQVQHWNRQEQGGSSCPMCFVSYSVLSSICSAQFFISLH